MVRENCLPVYKGGCVSGHDGNRNMGSSTSLVILVDAMGRMPVASCDTPGHSFSPSHEISPTQLDCLATISSPWTNLQKPKLASTSRIPTLAPPLPVPQPQLPSHGVITRRFWLTQCTSWRDPAGAAYGGVRASRCCQICPVVTAVAVPAIGPCRPCLHLTLYVVHAGP
jgi:hypothetical protein